MLSSSEEDEWTSPILQNVDNVCVAPPDQSPDQSEEDDAIESTPANTPTKNALTGLVKSSKSSGRGRGTRGSRGGRGGIGTGRRKGGKVGRPGDKGTQPGSATLSPPTREHSPGSSRGPITSTPRGGPVTLHHELFFYYSFS